MGEREGWVGVCVAACPAWRAEHLQEHSGEGRTVAKHDRMNGVPPSWMCVCVCTHERTALGMLGEVHSQQPVLAAPGSAA